MKSYLVVFGLSFALLVSSSARCHAQVVERICGQMPCNFEQFKAGTLKLFALADVNRDGQVDAQEQKLFWLNNAQNILPACKNIQDLVVLRLDKTPTDDQIHQQFSAADASNDGLIDQNEDKRITTQVNQTCQIMHDPQIQKVQQMLQKFRQGSGGK